MEEIMEFVDLYERGLISRHEMDLAFEGYLSVQRRPPRLRRHLYNLKFNLEDLEEEEVRRLFRFDRSDILRLRTLLRIPDTFRSQNSYNVSGTTALCVLLRRLAVPNLLSDNERLFGLAGPTLSKIVKDVTAHILNHFEVLLTDLLENRWLSTERIRRYLKAVRVKGAALHYCWAFIDGTARKICPPTDDQRKYYSGHKSNDSLKFQGVLSPDGIVVSLLGPFQDKQHDAGINQVTNLEEQLRIVAPNLIIYGDPAYTTSDLLIAPFPKGSTDAINKSISAVRQAVKRGFGKVETEFAFLDSCKNKKLFLQPVAEMYLVGTILANCHTCLYGSIVAEYFNLPPPTLEQYLNT